MCSRGAPAPMRHLRKSCHDVRSVIRRTALALALVSASGLERAHDDKAGMPAGGSGELHATLMKGMQDAKMIKTTGDVDKDFAAMAKVLHEKSQNPELKAMAQKMSEQQKKEIDDLKRFK